MKTPEQILTAANVNLEALAASFTMAEPQSSDEVVYCTATATLLGAAIDLWIAQDGEITFEESVGDFEIAPEIADAAAAWLTERMGEVAEGHISDTMDDWAIEAEFRRDPLGAVGMSDSDFF
jgi:hypothetical protein